MVGPLRRRQFEGSVLAQALLVAAGLLIGTAGGGVGMQLWKSSATSGDSSEQPVDLPERLAKMKATVQDAIRLPLSEEERNAKLDELLNSADNLNLADKAAMIARQKQYMDLLTPEDLPRAKEKIVAAACGEKIDPTFLMAVHPLWAVEDSDGLADWLVSPQGKCYQYSSRAFEMLGRAYGEKGDVFANWEKMERLYQQRGQKPGDTTGMVMVALAAAKTDAPRAQRKALALPASDLKIGILSVTNLEMYPGDMQGALRAARGQVANGDVLQGRMILQAIHADTAPATFQQMGDYLVVEASEPLRGSKLQLVMFQWGLADPATANKWMSAHEMDLKAYGLTQVRKDLTARATHYGYDPGKPAPARTSYDAIAFGGPGGSAEVTKNATAAVSGKQPVPAPDAPSDPVNPSSPLPSHWELGRIVDPAATMDARAYAGMHPKDALARLSQMPEEQAKRVAPRLLRGIAEYDPARAAEAVMKLPREQRAEAAKDVIDQWMLANPTGATAWLAKQSAGPVKDAGIVHVVKHTANSDPEGAALWALQAHGETIREEQLYQAAREWRKSNPREAREWARQQKLPPASLQAFLSGLN